MRYVRNLYVTITARDKNEGQGKKRIVIRPHKQSNETHVEAPLFSTSDQVPVSDNSLQLIVQTIEQTAPGEMKEFTLPEHADIVSLIQAIGNTKRSFEFGGDHDPTTGVIRVRRSETQSSGGFVVGEALPSTGYHRRRDVDGKIIGNLWHTHPWETQEKLYKERYPWKYRPELNCCPSTFDNQSLFAIAMIEAEEGNIRKFKSYISAAGFTSETTSTGTSLDLSLLRSLGCNELAIRELLRCLAILPPAYMENIALAESKSQLLDKVTDYYQKKLKKDGSFSREITQFILEVESLLSKSLMRRQTTKASVVLKEQMLQTLASYPDRKKLKQLGFDTIEKQDAVLEMLGMKTSIFKLDEKGNKVFIVQKANSCDVFDTVLTLESAK